MQTLAYAATRSRGNRCTRERRRLRVDSGPVRQRHSRRATSTRYSERPSRSAQALATAEFGASVPGIVAHPPFSMIDRWSQVFALANSFSFAGASGCCRKRSTQIGASASTSTVCARSLAIRSAVSLSVHPKIEKPTTDIAAAPITAPQIPDFKLGGKVTDLMSYAPSAHWATFEHFEFLLRLAIRATTYAKARAVGEMSDGKGRKRAGWED